MQDYGPQPSRKPRLTPMGRVALTLLAAAVCCELVPGGVWWLSWNASLILIVAAAIAGGAAWLRGRTRAVR
jgi:hypothetical protein